MRGKINDYSGSPITVIPLHASKGRQSHARASQGDTKERCMLERLLKYGGYQCKFQGIRIALAEKESPMFAKALKAESTAVVAVASPSSTHRRTAQLESLR
jgi:hypothetical protein